MKSTTKIQFKRLPKKNIEEIQRLLDSLGRRLDEIGKKAEAIEIDQIRKQL
ncbi:MAG: hypothetical protein ACOYL8_02345 [Patescibacteria group bacterium]